jgi:hypothetical protein
MVLTIELCDFQFLRKPCLTLEGEEKLQNFLIMAVSLFHYVILIRKMMKSARLHTLPMEYLNPFSQT